MLLNAVLLSSLKRLITTTLKINDANVNNLMLLSEKFFFYHIKNHLQPGGPCGGPEGQQESHL